MHVCIMANVAHQISSAMDSHVRDTRRLGLLEGLSVVLKGTSVVDELSRLFQPLKRTNQGSGGLELKGVRDW